MIRKLIKITAGAFLYYCGLFHLVRAWRNRLGARLTILTFHRIGESARETHRKPGLPTLYLNPDAFRGLVDFVGSSFHPISFQHYLRQTRTGQPLQPDSVILTFDDGYREVYDKAWPVLRAAQLSAAVFLPVAFIGSDKAFWWDEYYARHGSAFDGDSGESMASALNELNHEIQTLQDDITALNHIRSRLQENDGMATASKPANNNQAMTWEQVQEMAQAGIEFGSHTVHHLFLSSIPHHEAVQEIIESKQRLETEIQPNISLFSYPGGRISERIRDCVQAAGYDCAVTTEPGLNALRTDPFRLRRINIWDGNVTGLRGGFSKSLFVLHWLRSQANTPLSE